MKASSLSFKTAVLFAIAGMAMGIAMAASHDHAVMPAHAHLNLLGWVSLFLIGAYYRFNPALDASRAAVVQVGVWILGTIVLTTGVTAIYLGNPSAEPIAVVGSLIILADMLFFAFLVYRPAAKDSRAAGLAPAE
jgi:peptidoglycan/LPS O-acetylase OafA/YrhL